VRLPQLDSSRLASALATTVLAASFFWIAYDDGSYSIGSRNALAMVVWWTVIVVLVFSLVPDEPAPPASFVLGGLLAALALWTLASVLWAKSAERAFDEVNRVTLYLGVFVLVSAISSRSSLHRFVNGFAVAVSAVAGVALVSRLFHGSFPSRDLEAFLPAAATRLSFPLGYWNGLAIFLALGVPPLLRTALVSRGTAMRALALAPVPAIAAVIYLASSRGGMVCALVGSSLFLVLTERRWEAAGALAVSSVGSLLAIAVLLQYDELVDGPLGTDLVERQGREAAVLIALACAVTSAGYLFGVRVLRGIRPARVVGWVVVLGIVALVAGAVVASDPAQRFETFKAPPGELQAIEQGDFVRQHLLSSRGSGRWQFWSAAIDQMREAPILGQAAGSYESWWAQNGSIALFVRDAHSLPLETFGELGAVGLSLVLALVLAGICIAVARAWSTSGHTRIDAAALGSVFAAYVVGAALDWVWELTAVSVAGFSALALVAGRATAPRRPLSAVQVHAAPRWKSGHRLYGVAAILAAWVLVFAQAIPLLAQREIGRSQAAVEDGDLREALDAAQSARDIQPWAATPYLQLALVNEQAGALRLARTWIDMALARDAEDWRLWLVSARLETKLGRVAAAERSLRRAIDLNPRSPLFDGRPTSRD
jgi:Flp pilus assembly protein TadD